MRVIKLDFISYGTFREQQETRTYNNISTRS